MQILSALSMSRSISLLNDTRLCPPVNKLLVRKPVNGRTKVRFVAFSLTSSCLDNTAESICFSSANFSLLSSPRKSINLLTKEARSSAVRFSSDRRLRIMRLRCSAIMLGDSAPSISSFLHTNPSPDASSMSCLSPSVIRFSYVPSVSFIAIQISSASIHYYSIFFGILLEVFSIFFSLLATLHSTFFISSAGGSFSGFMPHCLSICLMLRFTVKCDHFRNVTKMIICCDIQ